MEDLLELVLTVVVEIVDAAKFKNPKTRTWAMTIICALFSLFVIGTSGAGAVMLYKQDNPVGASVMGGLTVAALLVSVVILVKGHRSNWERR